LGEAFETESVAGHMMMNTVGCFAQFEREIIVERIKRGFGARQGKREDRRRSLQVIS
jgi:DNA invertase Pin-like site-specific DNA recombinase